LSEIVVICEGKSEIFGQILVQKIVKKAVLAKCGFFRFCLESKCVFLQSMILCIFLRAYQNQI